MRDVAGYALGHRTEAEPSTAMRHVVHACAWLLALSILAGCSSALSIFSACYSGPADLIGEFRSHMSTQEVASLLAKRGHAWKVVEKGGVPPGDKRPPYSVEKWLVHGFAEGDFSGDAEFEFLNDRLVAIAFYPADLRAYLALREPGARGDPGEQLGLARDRRINVRICRSPQGRPCVVWESIELREWERGWIARYG